MRTSTQIQAEIVARFGFVPPFFSPAFAHPRVFENLWQQTLIAYVDNPLPARFKEMLSAYLSRYCAVPYCMVCHSCTLRPLGMTARQVLDLLVAPAPLEEDIHGPLARLLAAPGPPAGEWSPAFEADVLACAVYTFLKREGSEQVLRGLHSCLGTPLYQHLVAFLAYIRTCLQWMEANPEVLYEEDLRAQEHLGPLVAEEPALLNFLAGYRDWVRREHERQEERQAVLAERRRNEAALRRSEERLRLCLDAARMATWEWDRHTDTIAYTGYADSPPAPGGEPRRIECAAFVGRIHPDDRRAFEGAVRRVLEGKDDLDTEFRVLHQDGVRWVWVACRGTLYRATDGTPAGLVGLVTDVTARKQAEEQLLLQSQYTQLLAALTLRIRQSLRLDEVLQTTAAEVRGALGADRVLVYRLSGDQDDPVGRVVAEAIASGGQSLLDARFSDPCLQNRDRPRPGVRAVDDVESSDLDPCYANFLRALGVGAVLSVPIVLHERPWGLLIVHQCATRRHWSDLEAALLAQLADQVAVALTQAQLLESQARQREELARSNAELERFASVASHDLQEPLRKIRAFGDRLVQRHGTGLDTEGRDYLSRMQSAAARMQQLIDGLLELSRVTTRARSFERVDLALLVRDVLLDLEVRIEQVAGCVEVGPLPVVEAEPLQMRQLFLNLLGNALKFRRPGVQPVVSVRVEATGKADPFTRIVVEDNGIGFDEKYLDRIFEVFQRLHGRGEYEGTGIGLAICRKIVERHSGTLTASSTPGEGARFVVALPAARLVEVARR